MGTKRCSKCALAKPRSDFYKQVHSGDGLHAWCKECFKAEQRARRLRDPEHAKEMQRRKYVAAKSGTRLRHTPEPGTPEWHQRHRWSRCLTAARRQARKWGVAVSDLTLDQWVQKVADHEGHCYYCGVDGEMTIEHVVPLFKGGPNTFSNVVPACAPCNWSKRLRSEQQMREDLCHRGHPLTGDNLYVPPDGKRVCRTCRREAFRRYREKKRMAA